MIEGVALSPSLQGSATQFGHIFWGRGIFATASISLPVGALRCAMERLQKPSE
jgi:hypothetical protein